MNENNELRLTFVKPSDKNISENNSKSLNSHILKDNYNRNEIKIEINNNYNNNSINEDYKSNMLLTPNNNSINYSFGKEEIKERNNISDFKNKNTSNFFKLTENVKNILYNNNEDISLNEQRKIYNKFKKRFPFFRNKLNDQLSLPHFNSEKIERYINLKQNKNPKIRLTNNKNLNLDQLISTANELRTLRDKSKLNKNFLSENNLLKTIRKETKSFFLIPTKKSPKKNILSPHEIFYYDAKKWKKTGNSHKTKNNDLHFNQINKQIDETIKEMKNKCLVLNQEIFKLEEIRNKMKSQNKLMAVKSKSFINYKSQFMSNDEKRKFIRQKSKYYNDS